MINYFTVPCILIINSTLAADSGWNLTSNLLLSLVSTVIYNTLRLSDLLPLNRGDHRVPLERILFARMLPHYFYGVMVIRHVHLLWTRATGILTFTVGSRDLVCAGYYCLVLRNLRLDNIHGLLHISDGLIAGWIFRGGEWRDQNIKTLFLISFLFTVVSLREESVPIKAEVRFIQLCCALFHKKNLELMTHSPVVGFLIVLELFRVLKKLTELLGHIFAEHLLNGLHLELEDVWVLLKLVCSANSLPR